MFPRFVGWKMLTCVLLQLSQYFRGAGGALHSYFNCEYGLYTDTQKRRRADNVAHVLPWLQEHELIL